jgi:hypothetical protein
MSHFPPRRHLKSIAVCALILGALSISAVAFADTFFKPLTPVAKGTFFPSIISSRPFSYLFAMDASVTTDKRDYSPGSTALIAGSGFGSSETVTLQVTHSDGTAEGGEGHESWAVTTDPDGNFASSWYVHPDDSFGSTFLLTADGQSSRARAQTTFTDAGNPSAELSQCANDKAPSPSTDGCSTSAADWDHGNLGASKSVYQEGDSIPYRMEFDNLPLASHTVIIEWDTTKSDKHAIDYLTTFNRTVATADPCLGVSGCSLGTSTTSAIPADPQVTGAGVTPAAGNFTLFGGTITSVSAYSYADGAGFTGDKSARIAITFTAGVVNPVLAWGGHIATRQDWGLSNSAVAIPGSPYHTRLISLDGSGGNQDRSLSAEAVIFPGSITIIKNTVPNGLQDFGYTTTGGLSPATFTLDDDSGVAGGDATNSNTQAYSNILVTSNTGNNYTVSETTVAGWDLSFGTPACTVTSANGGSSQASDADTVSINLREGENVTCTFINTENENVTKGKIKVVKVTNPNPDPTDPDASFTFSPSYGVSFNLTNGQMNTSDFLTPGTGFTVTESTIPTGWELQSATCDNGNDPTTSITVTAGQTVTCTFTNRLKPKLTVNKVLSPSSDPGTFNLIINSTTYATGGDGTTTGAQFGSVGSNTFGETGAGGTNLTNYTTVISGTGCTDNGDGTGSITLAAGDNKVCTITNTRNTGKLEVVKSLSPTNDTGRFNLQIDGVTQKANAADGDTTGEKTLNTGLHNVGEIIGNAGALADYQKSISCIDTAHSNEVVASVGADSAGPLNVQVDSGDDIVCTITNTRETGKLEVVKSLSPTDDTGRFNLQIDGVTQKANAANGDTTGEKTVNTGLHNVGEIIGNAGALADYQKSISCIDTAHANEVVASVGTDNAGPLNVQVDFGDDIVCTVTNTRKTGKLEVVKSLSPTNDAGRFNLQIDGGTQKTDAANGDTTGEKTVNTGLHNVGEVAGSVGALADYQKSISCVDTANGNEVVASVAADNAGPLNVQVDFGDDIVCTITNTRETGKLEVVKSLNPTTDPGLFNLQIDGATQKTDATNGQSTGEKTVNTGLHNVGEVAGSVGVLTDYVKSIVCKDSNGAGATVASGSSAGPLDVTVNSGDDIVCTITNSRIPRLRLVKDIVPNSDTGVFDLSDSVAGLKVDDGGDGADSGFFNTTTGAHTVSEAAGTGTTLSDYLSKVDCPGKGSADPGTSLMFSLGYGDAITCTFTNTKKGMAQVVKTVNGSAPTSGQSFTFQIRQGASATQNGTVLETGVANSADSTIDFAIKLTPSATYQICEIVMPGWMTTLGTFVPGSFMPPDGVAANPNVDNSTLCGDFTVSPGETKVFTVDNTPPPGGRALTIGFWKNWSGSCNGGRQADVLGQTLASFVGGGVFIGDIFVNLTCTEAVPLLDKREVGGSGKKSAGDAAYGLAAQLLAARLNVQAGAGVCPNVIIAIDQAQALLDGINFTGTGTYLKKMNPTTTAKANCLASQLDDYNNNRAIACTESCP